jgi:hypothetical protein
VVRPVVDSGARVHVGQVIAYVAGATGQPGSWEFMVGNYHENRAYCPLLLLPPDRREQATATFASVMRVWESLRSDTPPYEESAMPIPGCLTQSMATY